MEGNPSVTGKEKRHLVGKSPTSFLSGTYRLTTPSSFPPSCMMERERSFTPPHINKLMRDHYNKDSKG